MYTASLSTFFLTQQDCDFFPVVIFSLQNTLQPPHTHTQKIKPYTLFYSSKGKRFLAKTIEIIKITHMQCSCEGGKSKNEKGIKIGKPQKN